jgi:transcriptional regulator with XRE-family HTH domain
MNVRAAFGPNLRRTRIHHGISLEAIAEETKVPVALWEGLEDNNLAGWPRGIYARAYIREYAQIIGVDPDDTVNEFCRLFPEGDRRQARLLRQHAEIVGHDLTWSDDLRGGVDRRSATSEPREKPNPVPARVLAAVVDGGIVLGLASVAGVAVPSAFAARVAFVSVLYYIVHLATGGNTPSLRVTESALAHASSPEPLARRFRTFFRSGKRSENPSHGEAKT